MDTNLKNEKKNYIGNRTELGISRGRITCKKSFQQMKFPPSGKGLGAFSVELIILLFGADCVPVITQSTIDD